MSIWSTLLPKRTYLVKENELLTDGARFIVEDPDTGKTVLLGREDSIEKWIGLPFSRFSVSPPFKLSLEVPEGEVVAAVDNLMSLQERHLVLRDGAGKLLAFFQQAEKGKKIVLEGFDAASTRRWEVKRGYKQYTLWEREVRLGSIRKELPKEDPALFEVGNSYRVSISQSLPPEALPRLMLPILALCLELME
jgi:hypothetical protein